MIIGLIFLFGAALVHIYIWIIKSFLWTKESTENVFKLTHKEALTTKPLAFNQGFYNLFLAVIICIGIALVVMNKNMTGLWLLFTSAGSMILASIVLIISDRSRLRPAIVQGILPLIGCVLLVIRLMV